jgi:hypothetical protein
MSLFRREPAEPEPDPLEERLVAIEATVAAVEAALTALAERELPASTNLVLAEELPEGALPRDFREAAYKAGRDAKEALLFCSGFGHRLSELEALVKDPSLGIERTQALEHEFDRLVSFLASTMNFVFRRERPNV